MMENSNSIERIEKISRQVNQDTLDALKNRDYGFLGFFSAHEKAIRDGEIILVKDEFEKRHKLAKLNAEMQIGFAKEIVHTVISTLVITNQQEIASRIADAQNQLSKKIDEVQLEMAMSTEKELKNLANFSDSRTREIYENQIRSKHETVAMSVGGLMVDFINAIKRIKDGLNQI